MPVALINIDAKILSLTWDSGASRRFVLFQILAFALSGPQEITVCHF